MKLPSLYHPPSVSHARSITKEVASTAVSAVLRGKTVDEAGAIDVGVQTHLWSPMTGDSGPALCGARPRGIYADWKKVTNAKLNCARCTDIHSLIME